MNGGEKVDGAAGVFVSLFVVAFWLGMAYVILHFVTKRPEWDEIGMELLIMALTAIAFYLIGYRRGQKVQERKIPK